MPSDPVSNPRPRPASIAAIYAAALARGDSVNDMQAENMSEVRDARAPVQRLIHSWMEDEKTVLKFVSPIPLVLCLLSY